MMKEPNIVPPPFTTSRPAPSPRNSPVRDARLDANFSTLIAQRAAQAKARRSDNQCLQVELKSNGLPPSTTFFNHSVTTNGFFSSNGKSFELNKSRK